eukprot:gnl/Chilomastix_cuspidata/6606.p1 GENE.gnl/Chilomastix_cuspidata/6606~~gnl/Chilomastix_cuspidata/6606.p1  ORF type:complete len:325 (+),score=122.75 gnl/Chilomastix_cuspidata/6606:22-996(+)
MALRRGFSDQRFAAISMAALLVLAFELVLYSFSMPFRHNRDEFVEGLLAWEELAGDLALEGTLNVTLGGSSEVISLSSPQHVAAQDILTKRDLKSLLAQDLAAIEADQVWTTSLALANVSLAGATVFALEAFAAAEVVLDAGGGAQTLSSGATCSLVRAEYEEDARPLVTCRSHATNAGCLHTLKVAALDLLLHVSAPGGTATVDAAEWRCLYAPFEPAYVSASGRLYGDESLAAPVRVRVAASPYIAYEAAGGFGPTGAVALATAGVAVLGMLSGSAALIVQTFRVSRKEQRPARCIEGVQESSTHSTQELPTLVPTDDSSWS